MKNKAKGKKDYLHSSPAPSLLNKIGSIFSNHTVHISSYPPSSILPSKPVSHYKRHTTPSSSTSTKPSKPVSHQKSHTTPIPSSSSSTKMNKPMPKHKGPSAASKQNTNPSISGAAWELAAGVGKLAFFVGKAAAIATTEVVKSGIEIAHNQIEHNEKLKETFVCYYTDPKRKDYQGTLHFSDNQIVFSTNHSLPPHTTSSYKVKQVEIKIPFQEVIEINQMNAENPSTRYIQIRGVLGSYTFWGFNDYYKTYNHIYSLLPSSS